MRIALPITVIAVCLLFLEACHKKDSTTNMPPEPSSDTGKLATSVNSLLTAVNTMYAYGAQHNVDAPTALINSIDEIKSQEGVADVIVVDSTCIAVSLTNGLISTINLRFQKSDSTITTRGGDRYQRFQNVLSDSRQQAKNRDVLFYSPVYGEFYHYGEDYDLEDMILNSNSDASFTRTVFSECTPSTIAHFGDYGLVLMDTHGVPFGFDAGEFLTDIFRVDTVINGESTLRYRAIYTEQELKSHLVEQHGQEIYDLLLSNKYLTGISVTIKEPYEKWFQAVNDLYNSYTEARVIATSKYMESLPGLDSTIILANFCYSGATFNGGTNEFGLKSLRDVMVQKNLGAYYCYTSDNGASAPVSNPDALKNEKSFVTSFFQEFDTSGNAHLTNADAPLVAWQYNDHTGRQTTLTLFGQDNLWFGCGGPLIDVRDGNVYNTVCIGKRRWMAENLRYNIPGSTLNSAAPDIRKFGRLYSFKEAMQGAAPSVAVPSGVQGACPTGWHLPSNDEWRELRTALGGSQVAGGASKTTEFWAAPNTGATNSSGLSLVPGGNYLPSTDMFNDLGTVGYWWNTSYKNNIEGNYEFFFVQSDDAGFFQGLYGADAGIKISVRCLEDY